MKKNQKTNRNILMINILCFFIFVNSNIYNNRNSFCNDQDNKKIIKYYDYYNRKEHYLYQKCNKNCCKYLKKLSVIHKLKKENQNLYLSEKPNPLSEIQINNNFINFKNIYFTDYDQLLFHQLSYQFTNGSKIYNSGLGYRKYCSDQWIIGNNIFYDTLLSSSQNNRKIFSIGNEFLKKFTHFTINTYHNMFDKNINNKKYLPFAYDIYIENRLPFFINTYAKINMEHYFNNKNNKTTLIQKQNITKHISNNKYKITLGLTYIPTQMFAFNINKIIFNSLKNHETTFNVTANYKISIPWIYKKKEQENNDRYGISQKKTWLIKNDKYTIHRNHTMLLFQPLNVDFNSTEPKNTTKHEKDKNNESKTDFQSIKNSDFHNSNNKNNTDPYVNSNTTKKLFKDPETSFSEKLYTNSKLNSQTQTISINSNNIENIQNKSTSINSTNNKSSLSNINDNKYLSEQIQITSSTNIDIQNEFIPQKILTQASLNTEKIKQKQQENNITYTNIPPPPPISDMFLSSYSKEAHDMNSDTRISNNEKNLKNTTKNIIIINEHKQSNFSSLGSEEHLFKLNNITKKRKKTISTSSNDSNDSESIRLLKIIERQSMLLTKNDDTDNEDTDSITSKNDFSE